MNGLAHTTGERVGSSPNVKKPQPAALFEAPLRGTERIRIRGGCAGQVIGIPKRSAINRPPLREQPRDRRRGCEAKFGEVEAVRRSQERFMKITGKFVRSTKLESGIVGARFRQSHYHLPTPPPHTAATARGIVQAEFGVA